jgi:hypothetical protein
LRHAQALIFGLRTAAKLANVIQSLHVRIDLAMPRAKRVAQLFQGRWASIARAAMLAVAVAAVCRVGAQQHPDSPPVVYLPGAAPPPPVAADSRAHEAAAKLAELTGMRQKLEQKFPSTMQDALADMRRHFPNLDPRFVAEWEKRMRAQFNPDDYIAVFIKVYEEHYTAAELEEMVEVVRARQKSEPVTVSPQLAEKIRANAVDVQSEIMGGFTEIGARQGGQIGAEIGREHPEWIRNANPAEPAATK